MTGTRLDHGQQHLAGIPEFGPALEQAWADGQRKWLGLPCRSTLSTAAESGHHVDQPDVAARVVSRAARG